MPNKGRNKVLVLCNILYIIISFKVVINKWVVLRYGVEFLNLASILSSLVGVFYIIYRHKSVKSGFKELDALLIVYAGIISVFFFTVLNNKALSTGDMSLLGALEQAPPILSIGILIMYKKKATKDNVIQLVVGVVAFYLLYSHYKTGNNQLIPLLWGMASMFMLSISNFLITLRNEKVKKDLTTNLIVARVVGLLPLVYTLKGFKLGGSDIIIALIICTVAFAIYSTFVECVRSYALERVEVYEFDLPRFWIVIVSVIVDLLSYSAKMSWMLIASLILMIGNNVYMFIINKDKKWDKRY